ncbi:unnamed protein product, partial [Brassica napus]
QCDRSSCVTRIQLRQKGIRNTLPQDLHKLSELVILETHVRRSEKTEQQEKTEQRGRSRARRSRDSRQTLEKTEQRHRRRQSSAVGAELVVLETYQTSE